MLNIRISEPARSDLEEIWQYIAENNPQAANTIISQLKSKFELIADQPNIGRERQEIMLDLKSFPHKKFIIFYFLTDAGIEIFRVLHSSRDIDSEFDKMIPGDSVN